MPNAIVFRCRATIGQTTQPGVLSSGREQPIDQSERRDRGHLMRTVGILHSGSNAKHFHDSQISGLMNGLASVGVDSTNTTITTLFSKDKAGTLQAHANNLATTLAAVAETKVFV